MSDIKGGFVMWSLLWLFFKAGVCIYVGVLAWAFCSYYFKNKK